MEARVVSHQAHRRPTCPVQGMCGPSSSRPPGRGSVEWEKGMSEILPRRSTLLHSSRVATFAGRKFWFCQVTPRGGNGGGGGEEIGTEKGPNMCSVQFGLVTQSCPTLCDPMDCSMPGFPVHHQLPEPAQTHVYWVGDAIQPSYPLSSPSPPTFNLSQHQGLFQWVSSSHQVAKVLEFQLQHQSFQWTLRTDFL